MAEVEDRSDKTDPTPLHSIFKKLKVDPDW